MLSDKPTTEAKKEFEPLQIMGTFWLVFSIVVLLATFFIKATPEVPMVRGVVTNIIAGLLLLAAGVFSILKGKANKRAKTLS